MTRWRCWGEKSALTTTDTSSGDNDNSGNRRMWKRQHLVWGCSPSKPAYKGQSWASVLACKLSLEARSLQNKRALLPLGTFLAMPSLW